MALPRSAARQPPPRRPTPDSFRPLPPEIDGSRWIGRVDGVGWVDARGRPLTRGRLMQELEASSHVPPAEHHAAFPSDITRPDVPVGPEEHWARVRVAAREQGALYDDWSRARIDRSFRGRYTLPGGEVNEGRLFNDLTSNNPATRRNAERAWAGHQATRNYIDLVADRVGRFGQEEVDQLVREFREDLDLFQRTHSGGLAPGEAPPRLAVNPNNVGYYWRQRAEATFEALEQAGHQGVVELQMPSGTMRYDPVGGHNPRFSVAHDRATSLGSVERQSLNLLASTLRGRLDRMGLRDVALRIVDDIVDPTTGEVAPRAVGLYWGKVIQVSKRAFETGDGVFDSRLMAETLDHEAVHAAREMGFFNEREWGVLEREARRRQAEPGTTYFEKVRREWEDAGYRLTDEEVVEESVAEMARHFYAGRLGASAEAKNLIARLVQGLRRIGAAILGTDTEGVLRRLESGDLARQAGREMPAGAVRFRNFNAAAPVPKYPIGGGWHPTEMRERIPLPDRKGDFVRPEGKSWRELADETPRLNLDEMVARRAKQAGETPGAARAALEADLDRDFANAKAATDTAEGAKPGGVLTGDLAWLEKNGTKYMQSVEEAVLNRKRLYPGMTAASLKQQLMDGTFEVRGGVQLPEGWKPGEKLSAAAADAYLQKPVPFRRLGLDFWADALSHDGDARFWYGLGAEAVQRRVAGLSDNELLTFLHVLARQSIQTEPNDNMFRALGTMSEVLRGVRSASPAMSQGEVENALAHILNTHKLGEFGGSHAEEIGLTDVVHMTTNDQWVARYYGLRDGTVVPNRPALYEFMARDLANITKTFNAMLGPDELKLSPKQVQAMSWVALRGDYDPKLRGDASNYAQALTKAEGIVQDKATKRGMQDILDTMPDGHFTRETLLHPDFTELLNPSVVRRTKAPIATIEVTPGAVLNEDGTLKFPHSVEGVAMQKRLARELETTARGSARAKRLTEALGDYAAAERRAQAGIGTDFGNLIKAITGEKVEPVSPDTTSHGVYHSVASTNVRQGLVVATKPSKQQVREAFERTGETRQSGHERYLTDDEVAEFLAITRLDLGQEGTAASVFTPVATGVEPDTYSVLFPPAHGVDRVDLARFNRRIDEAMQTGELSIPSNLTDYANGLVIDLLPFPKMDLALLREALDEVFPGVETNTYGNHFKSWYADDGGIDFPGGRRIDDVAAFLEERENARKALDANGGQGGAGAPRYSAGERGDLFASARRGLQERAARVERDFADLNAKHAALFDAPAAAGQAGPKFRVNTPSAPQTGPTAPRLHGMFPHLPVWEDAAFPRAAGDAAAVVDAHGVILPKTSEQVLSRVRVGNKRLLDVAAETWDDAGELRRLAEANRSAPLQGVQARRLATLQKRLNPSGLEMAAMPDDQPGHVVRDAVRRRWREVMPEVGSTNPALVQEPGAGFDRHTAAPP